MDALNRDIDTDICSLAKRNLELDTFRGQRTIHLGVFLRGPYGDHIVTLKTSCFPLSVRVCFPLLVCAPLPSHKVQPNLP